MNTLSLRTVLYNKNYIYIYIKITAFYRYIKLQRRFCSIRTHGKKALATSTYSYFGKDR